MTAAKFQSADLVDVLEAYVKAGTAKLHMGCPGVVRAYDFAACRAEVQPVLRGRRDGAEPFRYPPIANVPVLWPQGGGMSMVGTLEPGDFVWLLFGDRSLDEWLAVGGDDVVPQSARRFAVTDAVALPGISPFAAPPQNGDGVNTYLGEDPRTNPVDPKRLCVGPEGIALGDGTNDVLKILKGALLTMASATFGGAPIDPASGAALAAAVVQLDLIIKP